MASTPRPIRWLHLSDLHYGCPGKVLWEQVEREFFDDVAYWVERLGPPDLLLFTGDLAYSGTAEEFDRVEMFLDDLVERLTSLGGAAPIVLTVPGNHDVAWPSTRRDRLQYRILHDFDGTIDDSEVAELHRELWNDRDASFIEPLFPGYRVFFEQRIRPQLEARARSVHFSHFPCDFTAEIEPDGSFPLAVVGLNATWLQYTRGDFDGKLLIPHEQYRAALAPPDAKPYDVFDRVGGTLLLMHQPPSWLSSKAREIFDRSIFGPQHHSACLYGHMHAGNTTTVARDGGLPRVFLQSPSLFGVEAWGRSDEDRAFGYSWGQLGADGELTIWPRKAEPRGDGRYSFGHDPRFHARGDEGSILVAGSGEPVEPPTRGIDLGAYLDHVLDETSRIEIRGIVGDRDQSAALHPRIEALYTPLRCRDVRQIASPDGLGMRGETVELKDLLPGIDRLLIEGEPGAGKTTFLRLVACMLARDAKKEYCSFGPSWSEAFLGVRFDGEPPVPVFLRLAGLVDLWKDQADVVADRSCLLDLLARDLADLSEAFDREAWAEWLDGGRVWLLLDGLDEVADLELRQRLFGVARDAIAQWPGRVMVASRPFQTRAMVEMGFRLATVEPFAEAQIERFLADWTSALYRQHDAKLMGRAGRYRDRLEAAILTLPRIKAMARNPVMLTCLCIVHWNKGDLPDVRSRVYQAVIFWLLNARSDLRLERFEIEVDFAERTLSKLALDAMRSSKGKQSIFDLDAAVEIVLPAWARQRPYADEVACRELAREWLLFECEHSGVIEELAGERLRFWHLTFQEYLAALDLARRPEAQWRQALVPRLDDAQWREVSELFVTCLYDLGRPEDVDGLIRGVLDEAEPSLDLADEARAVGIVGRLLQPLERCGYRPEAGVKESYRAALDRSMAIFTLDGAEQVPVEGRIAAAEALGRGGDPRLQPDVVEKNFLPVVGVSWALGRYPVTVEEFRRFVDARGYEEARWWGEEGWHAKETWKWGEPESWEQQLRTPNRPVIGVSWWEAEAYCAWFSDQCGRGVRLPTEAEWERAAAHPQGAYPWGSDRPTPERANFARGLGEGYVGHATPVGIYPSGNGLRGHCDLAGNVWEWCNDRLEEEEAGRYTLAYPMKGGSWINHLLVDLRSAARNLSEPWTRSTRLGFRVICTLESSDRSSIDLGRPR